jgi:hypothetical protein
MICGDASTAEEQDSLANGSVDPERAEHFGDNALQHPVLNVIINGTTWMMEFEGLVRDSNDFNLDQNLKTRGNILYRDYGDGLSSIRHRVHCVAPDNRLIHKHI